MWFGWPVFQAWQAAADAEANLGGVYEIAASSSPFLAVVVIGSSLKLWAAKSNSFAQAKDWKVILLWTSLQARLPLVFGAM